MARNTHPLYKGNDAEFCRAMGWSVGTRIVGDEGYGPTIIQITAIGEEAILAKVVSHAGDPPQFHQRESNWTLECRNWSAAEEG